MSHHNKYHLSKQNILRLLAIVLTLALFLAAVMAVVKMVTTKNQNNQPTPTNATTPGGGQQTYIYNGKNYILRNNIETFLILGIDDYSEVGEFGKYIVSEQADAIFVFVIDHTNKTYQTLQLNRDTMTQVMTLDQSGKEAGEAEMQLALAHSYGKDGKARCENTVRAVSDMLLSKDIDHYMSLTMGAVAVLNDEVDGVTVTVPQDMTEADPAFTKGATVKLTGTQAESFVRARMSLKDDSNTFRMERHQIFLKSWKELATKKLESDSSFALDLVLSLNEFMVSDMSANDMAKFASYLEEYTDLGVLTTEGTYEDGVLYREFYVDIDDLEGKVVSMFYDEAPE